MSKGGESRPLLVNDDGWIIGASDPSLTADDLREKMVATYEGTPVGVLLWSVGGHEVYKYETLVGERFGEAYDKLDEPAEKRKAENLRRLIEDSGGPMTVLPRLCHEAGMGFFASVRMNEHYEIDPASPSYGGLRREHPELLIGRPAEAIPEGTIEYGIRTGLDYAFTEVRGHMARVITELFERFDVDGVELDWFRHPAFFRVEEAYANRYLATDLVRRVRHGMDQVGRERGRRMELAVRVPPTLADSSRIGLDVSTWIAEGLVDIVIAGGGFVPFETPLEEFVEAARGTDCRIYGCIERLRPTENDDVVRAIASRYWDAGASGIYLFNYFGQSPEWKRRVLGQIGDPAALARLDKQYEIDSFERGGATSQIGSAFRNAIPLTQLPAALEETDSGVGPILRFSVTDDLGRVTSEDAPPHSVMTLRFENSSPEDEFEVRLNGAVVPLEAGGAAGEDGTLEVEVGSPPLKRGENELEVRLLRRGATRDGPLALKGVALTVSYGRP